MPRIPHIFQSSSRSFRARQGSLPICDCRQQQSKPIRLVLTTRINYILGEANLQQKPESSPRNCSMNWIILHHKIANKLEFIHPTNNLVGHITENDCFSFPRKFPLPLATEFPLFCCCIQNFAQDVEFVRTADKQDLLILPG